MTIKDIYKDIQAFADDESEVILEKDGSILFKRQEKDILFKVVEDIETGGLIIDYNGEKKPYRNFLARDIARLDVFANKLLEKRAAVKNFTNSEGVLKTLGNDFSDDCLGLLNKTCVDKIFATKITFLTADAGHGKTALLKEFQHRQAKSYISKESNFIFWHVDLQGRELVRLNEAIMYDLGELRISGMGLYYASIMSLIRHGLIVLAIDGFDELAAEIGGTVALGALSHLVIQLENKGTIVAASRRTFFNTQDYVKRNTIMKSTISPECEFHEIKMENWNKSQVLDYIKSTTEKDPEKLYQDLLFELQGKEDHPILTRPFLVTKIIDILSEDVDLDASSLMKGIVNPTEGVAVVVEAFTKREVSKWKQRNTETGKPYLDYEQHLSLLEIIAEEMWLSQKEQLGLEEIEFFATSLCDEWNIDSRTQQRIVNMARSHALLIPSDIELDTRRFEHEEFKNYFIARALSSLLNRSLSEDYTSKVRKFLYVAQLPDSVAQFACTYLKKDLESIQGYLKLLEDIVRSEWKPTYLQINIGTMIPFILHNVNISEQILVSAKMNFSSLVFEGKILENIVFDGSNFINISFRSTQLRNIKFKNCTFNELRIYVNSGNDFANVEFEDCSVISIAEYGEDGYVIMSLYNPEKIEIQLVNYGLNSQKGDVEHLTIEETEHSEFKKALLRFLSIFQRTTVQYESNILNDVGKYKTYRNILLNEVIPFLEDSQIISLREKTKNAKQVLHRAWSLIVNLEDLLKYDGVNENHQFSRFWKEVNNRS